MCHEPLTCSLIQQVKIGKTPSGSDSVLHGPPETFNGVAVVPTAGEQQMQPTLSVPVRQRRGQFVDAMDTTPVDQHDHLFMILPEMAITRNKTFPTQIFQELLLSPCGRDCL
jgi:hypothetical protein